METFYGSFLILQALSLTVVVIATVAIGFTVVGAGTVSDRIATVISAGTFR